MQRVILDADGVILSMGKVGLAEVGVGKFAGRKIGVTAVCPGKVRLLKVHFPRHTFINHRRLKVQPHEYRIIEDALGEIQAFLLQEGFSRPLSQRPVDADHLGGKEAGGMEDRLGYLRQTQIAPLKDAIQKVAIAEGRLIEGAIEEMAGIEFHPLNLPCLENEIFKGESGLFGLIGYKPIYHSFFRSLIRIVTHTGSGNDLYLVVATHARQGQRKPL